VELRLTAAQQKRCFALLRSGGDVWAAVEAARAVVDFAVKERIGTLVVGDPRGLLATMRASARTWPCATGGQV
jgi:hypothetical protein